MCVQGACARIVVDARRGAGASVPALCKVAKDSGDRLRRKTENEVWKADWAFRLADVVSTFKKQWDAFAGAKSITKLVLNICGAPMPKSKGVCFSDCYLDADWNDSPVSPLRNCYFRAPYKFHLTEA
eukprot:10053444-Heterocapsa_arctica.AAC.1